MQTIEVPNLVADVAALPAAGAGRTRQLYHLVDLHASTEATGALRDASEREPAGVVSTVLRLADRILSGGSEDSEVRDGFRDAVTSPGFLALVPDWIRELRTAASTAPGTGACTVASALELWSWTMKHFLTFEPARHVALAIDELAEVLTPLVAARCLALDSGAERGAGRDAEIRRDLSHVMSARTSALAGAACAELVFGYRRHLVWDAEGCATCYAAEALDDLEALIPGMASGARMMTDVIETDGSHPAKAGPCVRFDGVETFMRLRNRLDGCLTGARIAKERAAAAMNRPDQRTAGDA